MSGIMYKSKRVHIINLFNDTSRYLGDKLTIDNAEFEKQIPDIYLHYVTRTSFE